jgi:hypothetical protein
VARLSFRDRFFTPPVARAMTSPSGILLAAGGVSAGILLAAPIGVAVGLGALAWAGRVAFAIPRNATAERIDPFTLGDPWRRYVQDALQAEVQFRDAVKRAERGPLRDRLDEIAQRLEVGVRECWRIARHAQALTEARRSIDVDRIVYDLQQIGPQAKETWAAGSSMARTAEALESQLATAQRMDQTLAEAEAQLRLLDARLDESVTRAIELSVQAHDIEDLAGLQGEVDDVVTDMEALRLALRETEQDPLAAHPIIDAGRATSAAPPPPPPPPTTMPATSPPSPPEADPRAGPAAPGRRPDS